jgi:glycosyltransferase involved in cell wall biosynthesis
MAARAIEILTDAPLRHRMGKRARQLALDLFDEQKIVPLYRELYERVIATPS